MAPRITARTSIGHFGTLTGDRLDHRTEPFERRRSGHVADRRWGYHQQMLDSPLASPARVVDEHGRPGSGVNLLSQDYLA
ncbi:hypothetical protein ACN20G_28950 (plasmid) [Streptomyces sp. BI20]|uniref:hypothetical protein n=1 Tax=Streptomyces sp. BI20 TaxID=3403460 RepID=UPI003C790E8F